MKMIRFTDIKQFRNLVDDLPDKPILKFIGTVKLHGTNMAVSWSNEEGIWCQSRNNIRTKDKFGFCSFIEDRKKYLVDYFEHFNTHLKDKYIITAFGEWCGKGIQKGVAINELEKMFVVFAVRFTDKIDKHDNWYVPPNISIPEYRIHNILDFKTFTITIDFNNLARAQEKITKMVESVERECPVAKAFGVSGIGEGIVFASYEGFDAVRQHIFKVKGEKHKISTTKNTVPIDPQKLKSINDFVEYAITENRLSQGIHDIFTINDIEPSMKQMGDYLRWVAHDVFKEELDVLEKNGLNRKDIGKIMTAKAKRWFMDYINQGGK